MVALFIVAGKLHFVMHLFKMKVRCATRKCLPSLIAQAETLQGPVGLLEYKSLMISKHSSSEMNQKQKEALPEVKSGVSSINLPKSFLDLKKRN